MSNLVKKNLTSEEKERILSDWKQSGLSKKKFAEERGLKYCTFVGWFQGSKKGISTPGFSEVVISSGDKLLMEVVIREKTIRFYQMLPKDYLFLLLQ
ncbi:MAG: hypothetical protein NTV09_08115 [Bacteroidetes bacterium]|jgi:hypothetical protein|nr:hypothetical protein [Bacteroidota bacterium]